MGKKEIMALDKNSAIAVVVDFPKKASSVVIPPSLMEASRYPVLWIHSVGLVAMW